MNTYSVIKNMCKWVLELVETFLCIHRVLEYAVLKAYTRKLNHAKSMEALYTILSFGLQYF